MSTLYADPATLWERVLRKHVARTPGGCWEFTGCLNSKGYGCTTAGRKGKTVLTHRLAVIVRDGSIPQGMTVDHLCRNRVCCNPGHLDVVTNAENIRRGHAARARDHIARQRGVA